MVSPYIRTSTLCRVLIALTVSLLATVAFLASPPSSAAPRANSLYLPLLKTSYGPGVHILSDPGTWTETTGQFHISGQVLNNTQWTLRLTRIIADMLDPQGEIAATSDAYTPMIYIWPGPTTCFQIYVPNPPPMSGFRFRPVEFMTVTKPIQVKTLTTNSVIAGYDYASYSYRISGSERNEDRVFPVGQPGVVATVFDTNGNVIGCESASAAANVLMPGQSAPFNVLFKGDYYSNVTNYTLQTQ